MVLGAAWVCSAGGAPELGAVDCDAIGEGAGAAVELVSALVVDGGGGEDSVVVVFLVSVDGDGVGAGEAAEEDEAGEEGEAADEGS